MEVYLTMFYFPFLIEINCWFGYYDFVIAVVLNGIFFYDYFMLIVAVFQFRQ